MDAKMHKRILIVEDSPTQALRVELILSQAGYEVASAENGQFGLEMALADPPDLVVADVNMPVMDGNEMTRRLRADARTAEVPILMLTANDQPLDVILGLEAGADHFMVKPYNDDTLVWRVNDLFAMLEKAKTGALLEQQQEVDAFSRNIVITPTRSQILQSLLQATAHIINCQAMALFITNPEGGRLLFPISFSPLEATLIDRMGQHLAAILSRVRKGGSPVSPTQITPVVVEETRFSTSIQGDLMTSFMSTPLIVDGQVVGMVGVFSAIPEVFDLQNVSYLFDLGQKTAAALSRLKAG